MMQPGPKRRKTPQNDTEAKQNAANETPFACSRH